LYADNGIFRIAKGGPSKVVAYGYYILTEPLTKGTYPIHFKTSLLCPDLVVWKIISPRIFNTSSM
jgi:hypothetical protein